MLLFATVFAAMVVNGNFECGSGSDFAGWSGEVCAGSSAFCSITLGGAHAADQDC